LTHVSDTVDSLLAVMRAPVQGLVLNSGNPSNVVSILDLAREIRQVCDSASPIELVDPTTIYGPLYTEAFDKVPHIRRIKAEIGWTPTRPLGQILEDTLAHYRRACEAR
jgi:nucleoside-diphosphate-sugar epimerase